MHFGVNFRQLNFPKEISESSRCILLNSLSYISKTLKNPHFQPSDASQRIVQLRFIAFVNLFMCHIRSAISKQLFDKQKGFSIPSSFCRFSMPLVSIFCRRIINKSDEERKKV
jgi:hypothetical protein